MNYGIKKESKFKVVLFKFYTVQDTTEELSNPTPTIITYEVDNNVISIRDLWELDETIEEDDYSEYISKYYILIPNYVNHEKILEEYSNQIQVAINIIRNTYTAIKNKYNTNTWEEIKEYMSLEVLKQDKLYADILNGKSPTLTMKIGEDQ